MERKTGFEPATATLARWSSTGLSYFRSGAECIGTSGGILNRPFGPRQGRPRSAWTVSSHRLNPLPIRRAALACR